MICFRAHSLRVSIESQSPEAQRDLGLLEPFITPIPLTRAADLAFAVSPQGAGFRLAWRDRSEAVPAGMLCDYIHHEVAAELARSGRCALFHTAALLQGQQAILLAGDSWSGKSTLTAALLKRGLGYLSDECALVSLDTGLVQPLPFPPKFREDALPRLPVLAPEVTISEVCTTAGGERVVHAAIAPERVVREGEWPIGAVYFLAIDPDRRAEIRPLRAGPAALKLLAVCLNREVLGPRVMDLVPALVRTVPAFDLVGDFAEAVQLIATPA